ncbi:MAG: nucleotidyltransferase family protein [Bacteroidaceae bacterium]|nr:nucleotidyltransferase family protein [Bacteroidaceae bacterium]
MQAFILAAGLGTRLKPLTDTMPKALVPVGGKPLLQHQIERLSAAGFSRIVINVHHFGEQIIDFVERYKAQSAANTAVELLISDERQELLDTGGALRHAAHLFDPAQPVLVHNVDILHNVDLARLYARHTADAASATLLVSPRDTSRYLVFDTAMHLIGWKNIKTGEVKGTILPSSAEDGAGRLLAFSGIHVLSPSLLSEMQAWPARFSIIDFYLATCRHTTILGTEFEGFRMVDVGKIDTLAIAEDFITKNR